MNTVENVSVKSISCAVPNRQIPILEYAPNLLNEKTAKHLTRSTGFASLRIAPDNMTASDLIVCAAEPILNDIDRSEIGAVVIVSQSHDYNVPATAHVLQDRLGLSKDVFCVDINEGCTGYIKGLRIAFLLANQSNRPVLLGDGDTMSRLTSPEDRSTHCIFGNAGTATLIAPTDVGSGLTVFDFVSLGEHYDAILMANKFGREVDAPLDDCFMRMDGVKMLNFTISEVPELIEKFLADNQLSKTDVSLYALHQANRLILTSIADKIGVPQDKIPFVMSDIGNVSSATIPLALTRCSKSHQLDRVLCCGFGAGLSIGVCLVDFSNTKFYGVFELE